LKLAEAGYILSDKELYFLASLTGSKQFYGFDYEEAVTTPREVEALWQKIEPKLIEKNYLKIGNGEANTLDEVLMRYVRTCAIPDYCLTCQSRVNGNASGSMFYIKDKIFAQLEKDNNMDDSYIMTPLRSFSNMVMNIREWMDYNEEFSIGDFSIDITPEQLKVLSQDTLSEIKKNPFASSVPIELLEDMANALNTRSNSKTLFLLDLLANDSQELLTFKGRKGLWQLDRQGAGDVLTLHLATTDSYQRSLKVLLESMSQGEVEERSFSLG
jgi:hypothetical protein